MVAAGLRALQGPERTTPHLTGAHLALTEGDREEAEARLREGKRLGRESLDGLRRPVGLLTRDERARADGAGDRR